MLVLFNACPGGLCSWHGNVMWAVWDTTWRLYPIRQRIKRNFQYWAMHNRFFGKILRHLLWKKVH